MKNLNKTQIEIEGLAPKLPKLTDAQRNWAVGQYVYHFDYNRQLAQFACPNCQHKLTLSTDKDKEEIRCPHCGVKIEARRYYDRIYKTNHREQFFQVMNVVGGWQVTRLFYMQRYTYVRKESTPWEFFEVCQAWNNPQHGTTYFRSLPKKCQMGWSYSINPYSLYTWRYECTDTDNWTYNKYIDSANVLEPRRAGGSNYFNTDKVAPNPQILHQYKRMGIDRHTFGATKYTAIGLMESISGKKYTPILEMLLKDRHYNLFNEVSDEKMNKEKKNAIFSAYKICKRNHYDCITSYNEWKDLVYMLMELGLDYRSPHYVCPENLHEMHQTILKRRIKVETNKDILRQLEGKIDYEERIAKFLDMDIHNDDLQIIVLPSVMAFKDEADHLHHCVFTCKYYEKVDSLILSARSRHGKVKRWETIEVNLKTFTINQSYGYGDKHTEKHKEIENLVMQNMWQIKERMGKKRMRIAS